VHRYVVTSVVVRCYTGIIKVYRTGKSFTQAVCAFVDCVVCTSQCVWMDFTDEYLRLGLQDDFPVMTHL